MNRAKTPRPDLIGTGYNNLLAHRFHRRKQCTQPPWIFAAGPRFHAAGYVHGIRLGHANRFGNILRRQTTRQNNLPITPRGTRQIPIERAASAAMKSTGKTIEQQGVRAPVR